jgi:hypothetical protein
VDNFAETTVLSPPGIITGSVSNYEEGEKKKRLWRGDLRLPIKLKTRNS